MKIILDDKGYFYGPFIQSKILLEVKARAQGIEPKFTIGHEAMKAMKEISRGYNTEHFFDLVTQYANSTIDDCPKDTNSMLMEYHLYRFLKNGSITYKLRPRMIDFFDTLTLDVPGRLFIPPFKEFMISVPFGSVEINGDSILNIYVAEEPMNIDAYRNANEFYSVEDKMSQLVLENQGRIHRVLRCYGIVYGKDLNALKGYTLFYQLPILEDESISEQYHALADIKCIYDKKEARNKMFDLVLKFIALLQMRGFKDSRPVVSSIRAPNRNNEKKLRSAERHNETSGYNFFDIGYLHEANAQKDYEIIGSGSEIKKSFKVRRHLRAQWYGKKSESSLGTHQEIILIEEFQKGAGGLKPRITIV